MDKPWHPDEDPDFLEVLVHTSARVTDADDEEYRKQGSALMDFLNQRRRTYKSSSAAIVLQTPVATVQVPETDPKLKPEAAGIGRYAPTESIVATGSSKKQVIQETVILFPRSCSNDQATSITSSTASFSEDQLPTPSARPQSAQASTPRRLPKGRRGPIWRDDPTAESLHSPEVPVSPDSARLVLQSRAEYQLKKRKRALPVEEPRRMGRFGVLREQSPNKRRKLAPTDDSSGKSQDQSLSNLDHSITPLEDGNWLGSIARLSSSMSIASASPQQTSVPSATSNNEGDPEADEAFFAPPPATAEEEFSTHKVGTLDMIANEMRLQRSWKPVSILRPIEALERGYWHLKIPDSWTHQDDFWEMLEDMVIHGKAGWGNWVEILSEKKTRSFEATKGSSSVFTARFASEIRIWCWGEVYREIWLALLMASRKQTSRARMQWYDSLGNLVVQMR